MPESDSPWNAVLAEIRRNVRPQQFDTWFRNVQAEELSADTLRLGVPNNFYEDWLRRHYHTVIQDAVASVTGWRPPVQFVVHPRQTLKPPAGPTPTAAAAPSPSRSGPLASLGDSHGQRSYYPVDWAHRLSRNYTFQNFVVGPTNQLAHAAALAICDSAAHAYNPLFIHGGVGLGKTHLVQAITHRLLDKNPDLRLLYLSCENFMNHFTSSIQHNEREKFRGVYRSLDVLLIDDVHFLCRGRREMTQEELFHTFNTLRNAEKQIVISSDSPPEDLPNFEERLVSRFKWGLVARIDPPTYETRVAILRKKGALRGHPLSDDVVHFVAEHVNTNIRDLEGAVTKIIGYASVVNAPITLDLAQEALRDTLEIAAAAIRMEDILRIVPAEFHIRLAEMQSKKRSKSLTYPRQIAMYLARTLTNHSLSEIGAYFGGRDHTTVMHACDKIGGLIDGDPSVKGTVERLTHLLRNQR